MGWEWDMDDLLGRVCVPLVVVPTVFRIGLLYRFSSVRQSSIVRSNTLQPGMPSVYPSLTSSLTKQGFIFVYPLPSSRHIFLHPPHHYTLWLNASFVFLSPNFRFRGRGKIGESLRVWVGPLCVGREFPLSWRGGGVANGGEGRERDKGGWECDGWDV